MLINGKELDISPCADLREANLRGANLRGADLSRAHLSGAHLHEANLSGANLSGADLSGANLRGADLSGANLSGVHLRGAHLRGADLSGANLRGADLSGAHLHRADLSEARLRGADLRGAHLHEADLRGAHLHDAKNIPALVAAQTVIAGEGELIGYKKLADGSICKIKIPTDARRSNATGRKCRCDFAVVLEGDGVSWHDHSFRYTVGVIVRPREPFCEDRWIECGSGIHFFLTREEAEAY